jgi:hypothetical protein
MLENIIVMQEDKKKRLEELMKKDEESAKRTTIILEKEEREFIDSLIREGKEPGIKPLISKMLDVYRSMMIYDWRFPGGEYYCGISRIAFLNVELVNILIKNIPREKWWEIGREMGEAAKVSMEANLGIQTANREKWQDVFKRLRVQGFGDFYLKDKYILIRAPFINEFEIWAGFLEGLLDIKVDAKTSTVPLVFEIKERQNPQANE